MGGAGAAVGYFAINFVVFAAWVHYFYAGSYSGPLWISTFFGISQQSLAAGARPVFEAPMAGWDGQFYYTQSNDPFLRDDYAKSSLIDNVSYRFQRNALPLLAWSAAQLCGAEYTSPLVYYLTQFLITSAGLGTLVAFLMWRGIHPAWAGVWGFYGGILRPLVHGLPDPTADALFIACIVAASCSRIWLYALFASWLCLCRESYAAPAAAVWVLTVLGRIDWGDCKNQLGERQMGIYQGLSEYKPDAQASAPILAYTRLRFGLVLVRSFLPLALVRIVVTATPGIVVLGWAFYVSQQTGTEFLAGSRSIPWGGLIDWPFKAYFDCLRIDIRGSDENDVIYSTSCAICLFVVGLNVVARVRQQPLLLAVVPHVVLMTMTGSIVWEAGVGFFKNTSSIVLLGIMLLPLRGNWLLRAALIGTFVASLHYHYRADFRHQSFLPPLEQTMAVVSAYSPGQLKVVPTDLAAVGQSELRMISSRPSSPPYAGRFSYVHRQAKTFVVRVTNTSSVTWPASLPGAAAITCGRMLRDGEVVLQEDRLPMYKDVAPGQWIDFFVTVPVSNSPTSTKFVRVGLVHDGKSWFYWDDEKQKLDLPY